MKNRQNQQAFTLVELMISLVLSLLVTYGIAQVLISTNQSSSSSDGVSQAQETARFVMSYLGGQIRPAGLDSIIDDDVNSQAVIGCDIAALSDPTINACSIENNAGTGDRLAISWIPPAGTTTDCTGANIAGFTPDTIIVNVFWVGFDATANSNSLFCRGHLFDGTNVISGSAQAIANGVDAFHVLYGEATDPLPDNNARNVSHYVNADEVADWARVYAIKIAVMTRSIGDITNDINNSQYSMLDASLYNFNDAINRQVFSSTFTISNYQD